MICPRCGKATLRLLSRNNITQVEKYIYFACRERVVVEPQYQITEKGELIFKDSKNEGVVSE